MKNLIIFLMLFCMTLPSYAIDCANFRVYSYDEKQPKNYYHDYFFYVKQCKIEPKILELKFDEDLYYDLDDLLIKFGDGSYKGVLENYQAKYDSILIYKAFYEIANIRNIVNEEYPNFKKDGINYSNAWWDEMANLRDTKSLYTYLSTFVNYGIRKQIFNDYRVTDLTIANLLGIYYNCNNGEEEIEQLLAKIVHFNDNKPQAIYNAKSVGTMLYKNPNYFK